MMKITLMDKGGNRVGRISWE